MPGGQPCIRTQIRQAIIGKLRPKKILSRRDPGEVRIDFSLNWDLGRFYEEQEYQVPLEQVLEQAVTLTGYGNDVQITTCPEYMSQVWPETGPALVRYLQVALKIPYGKELPIAGKGTHHSLSSSTLYAGLFY